MDENIDLGSRLFGGFWRIGTDKFLMAGCERLAKIVEYEWLD
jgi:hypothetical protein